MRRRRDRPGLLIKFRTLNQPVVVGPGFAEGRDLSRPGRRRPEQCPHHLQGILGERIEEGAAGQVVLEQFEIFPNFPVDVLNRLLGLQKCR